jgi:hypothetical protein
MQVPGCDKTMLPGKIGCDKTMLPDEIAVCAAPGTQPCKEGLVVMKMDNGNTMCMSGDRRRRR